MWYLFESCGNDIFYDWYYFIELFDIIIEGLVCDVYGYFYFLLCFLISWIKRMIFCILSKYIFISLILIIIFILDNLRNSL